LQGEEKTLTKSELIVRLAERHQRLVARDADEAVKAILDAMSGTGRRSAHRDSRLWQFFAELPSAARRPQPQVRRAGAGTGQAGAALQGGQGVARARGWSRWRYDGHRKLNAGGWWFIDPEGPALAGPFAFTSARGSP
jgi:hypothetical protein